MSRASREALRQGIAWLLISEACYAVMRIATRAGAGELHWAEIAAARFLGGALVAVVAARMQGVSLQVRDARNAWLRSLFGTGGALCLFHALGTKGISVGDATTLYSTTPLWVAVLSAPLLGERVPGAVWGGVALGFAGVATLLKAGFAWNPTALLVLLGAVSYALAILRLRRLSGRESSEAIALHMSLTAGITMLLIALPHLKPVPVAAYLPLVLSALSGGLGQVTVGRAYAHGAAAQLAALGYSGVVFTYLLESALFHRAPQAHQVLGAAMVIGAGVWVALASRAATGFDRVR
ncbi:MAG: DMT family transporter [Candidatus Eisenbacteria bacterium]